VATKTQKAKVGVFAAVSAVLIVGGAMIVGGYQTSTVSNYFITYDESVLGLSEGGVVEYRGVPVGKVLSIAVNPDNRIRVGIQVRDDVVTLRRGVEASLVISSFATGILYVSLEGGDANSPILPEGAEIPAKPSLIEGVRAQFDVLVTSASSILERVDASLEGLEDRTLVDIVDDIADIVGDARRAMEDVADTLAELRPTVSDGIRDFRHVTEEIGELANNANGAVTELRVQLESLQLAETEAKVQAALDTVVTVGDDLGKNITQLTESLERTIDSVRYDADTSSYALQQGLESIRETLESLRLLTDYLRRDPASLVRGRGEALGD